jgi:hypothetical protein
VPFCAGFDGRAKIRNVRLHLIVGTFGKEVLKIGREVTEIEIDVVTLHGPTIKRLWLQTNVLSR